MTNAPKEPSAVDIRTGSMLEVNEINVDEITARALANTVQSFPPAINAGAFLIGEVVRGPILPPYGTKERDRMLRVYDKMEYNSLWQGAVSGLIKKIASTPWEITGNSEWNNVFQAMLQNAQFGQGWSVFLKRFLRDYLTQDYGAWLEKIGGGPKDGPLMGPVYGVAHLDSGRCYVTGNPTWPVVYFSLMTGAMHKLHHSRVIRMVDMPNPDDRYFGIGLCALSRCIGVVQREIRMQRYIDAFMDDKPKPGITSISGVDEPQFNVLKGNYLKKQNTNDGDPFGKSFILFSMDLDKPITVDNQSFAQTPEKFDFKIYVELDINSIALGLGVDRQELWELSGRALGSGGQSYILAQKAEGKAFGDILQSIERFMNIEILPVGMEFKFKTKNTVADAAQSDIDQKYAMAMSTVAGIPGTITPREVRSILANKSSTFADAFTKPDGTISLDDSDIQTPHQENKRLLDDNPPKNPITPMGQPLATVGSPGAGGIGGAASSAVGMGGYPKPAFNGGTSKPPKGVSSVSGVPNVGAIKPINIPKQKPPTETRPSTALKQLQRIKDFNETRIEFIRNIVDLVSSKDEVNRRRFGIVFRAQLRRLGQRAFKDGLEDGGVLEPLDEDDLQKVQSWTVDQSVYVSQFANEVYHQGLVGGEIFSRAEIWANKSLQQMYDAGVLSADRNGIYEWVFGQTERHCRTCSRLAGQRHRFKDWQSRGLVPKSNLLACGGYRCDCTLVKSSERARGRF